MLFRVMANYTNSITLDSFQLIWADRTSESGKRKGGGLVVFVNYRWWNSGHITIKEQICCKDIELLARLFYLMPPVTFCTQL